MTFATFSKGSTRTASGWSFRNSSIHRSRLSPSPEAFLAEGYRGDTPSRRTGEVQKKTMRKAPSSSLQGQSTSLPANPSAVLERRLGRGFPQVTGVDSSLRAESTLCARARDHPPGSKG